MWLEAIHKSESDRQKCPSCGGGVQRRLYGEMYAGAFVLDGRRVEIRRTPAAGFADPIYLDPLTQYFDGGLYRLWPAEKYLSRGGKTLHRAVWKAAFGEIPKSCHIHHKDGDTLNNALGNLECLDAREHLADSWAKRKTPSAFTENARERAADWHKSAEGRLWHRRHAERSKSWLKWKRVEKPCGFCGKIINALERASGHSQKYCSNVCKAADYRKRKEAARTV